MMFLEGDFWNFVIILIVMSCGFVGWICVFGFQFHLRFLSFLSFLRLLDLLILLTYELLTDLFLRLNDLLELLLFLLESRCLKILIYHQITLKLNLMMNFFIVCLLIYYCVLVYIQRTYLVSFLLVSPF
jgi:hypothetical protein